jgi:hypothetical protein
MYVPIFIHYLFVKPNKKFEEEEDFYINTRGMSSSFIFFRVFNCALLYEWRVYCMHVFRRKKLSEFCFTSKNVLLMPSVSRRIVITIS